MHRYVRNILPYIRFNNCLIAIIFICQYYFVNIDMELLILCYLIYGREDEIRNKESHIKS